MKRQFSSVISLTIKAVEKGQPLADSAAKIFNLSFIPPSMKRQFYTANVLPMETTDFICVQNPVLVYLYFLKEYTADFILKI